MYITDIKKCHKMLSNVFVDGEFFAKIYDEILLESNLKIGSEVDELYLEKLKSKSDYKRAKNKSLYLLSFRDYSKKELSDKLKKDYCESAVTKVIQRMEDLAFIDDAKFAKKYANELLFNKHFSKKRTEFELSRKGINREIICEILDEINFDPVEHIKILLEKKYKSTLLDEKTKRRAFAFFQRYGYSWNDIRQAFESCS